MVLRAHVTRSYSEGSLVDVRELPYNGSRLPVWRKSPMALLFVS